ncbi:Gfo/Idh/MocA family oxidoreductase, partial [Nocardiopsis tropica]|nr:Gfo/Idh/MocA family oxidoreductase [Nocardiopsis tropica]
EVFGAERWLADPFELICDPSVDLVTVAVKVPAHRELVLAALAAGKAVYSESPLGATTAQTEEMAAAAGRLHTAIGLQGRHNPSVRRAGQIVAEGRLGRLLSARVAATTYGNGPETVSAYAYFDKAAAGAGFLTIAVGHVLDVVEAVLGRVTEIDARTELLWPRVRLTDTGEMSVRETPDHLDAVVKTASGAPVGVQVLAGVPAADARFCLEVRGCSGRRPRADLERGVHGARRPRRHRHRPDRRGGLDRSLRQRGRGVRRSGPRHQERDVRHPGIRTRRPQQPTDRPGGTGRAHRPPAAPAAVTDTATDSRTRTAAVGSVPLEGLSARTTPIPGVVDECCPRSLRRRRGPVRGQRRTTT